MKPSHLPRASQPARYSGTPALLLSGKAVGGVLSLAYISIAARSLGPTEMGYLVLAHAYLLVIVGIARFQSWQAIIRFGAPLLAIDDARDFKTLIRFTAKIDFASAVFVIVISTSFAGLVGKLMNWPPDADALYLCLLCCGAIPHGGDAVRRFTLVRPIQNARLATRLDARHSIHRRFDLVGHRR